MTNLTPKKYKLMKQLLSKGSLPVAELRKIDQRVLRGAYRKGQIVVVGNKVEITEQGYEDFRMYTIAPLERKDYDAPLSKVFDGLLHAFGKSKVKGRKAG